MIHFVYIPFTGLGLFDGFRGQEWFKNRAKIFQETTLKSLLNQSTKDFIVWISFRPQERKNPVTRQIRRILEQSGLRFVFTFDGVMMYDDRGLEHNKDLKERMARSLKVLKPLVGKEKWVYKTDCGSDDMLHKDALKEIQQEEPREKGATYYLNGYIYNYNTGQLADWIRNTSCSKYTVIYPADIFLNAEKHLEYIDGLKSHEYLPLVFDATRLPDGRYCCCVHGYNISTGWNNSFRGEEYFGEEKNKILKQFGL